ncbi:MAG: hypothetical protein ACR2PB_00265 [Desulfocapsaceae bacterium]
MTAQASAKISNPGSRTSFIRVVVENAPNEVGRITEVSQQGSHMLTVQSSMPTAISSRVRGKSLNPAV